MEFKHKGHQGTQRKKFTPKSAGPERVTKAHARDPDSELAY